MLTLSQATADTRKILKYLAIFFGAILSIIIIVRGIFALKEIISPTPPLPPTVSFGRLPKIDFPQSATQKKLKYTLNTISGGLPTFPDRATVNKMVYYAPNVLDVDNANRLANAAGFPTKGTSLSDVNYRWNDLSAFQRELTMNVVTKDFIISSLFLKNPDTISAKKLGNEQTAAASATNFLQTMNEFAPDLDSSKTSTILYSIVNGALLPASSLSNTQVIGVYFYQKDVNGLPIFYQNGGVSSMNVLVGGGQYSTEVVAVNFAHQEVSSTSATYPIKTTREALSDLKSGRGYIARYDVSTEDISIKNVFLAYYLGENKQEFLMPVVVFAGEGFYGYVSAARDEWLDK